MAGGDDLCRLARSLGQRGGRREEISRQEKRTGLPLPQVVLRLRTVRAEIRGLSSRRSGDRFRHRLAGEHSRVKRLAMRPEKTTLDRLLPACLRRSADRRACSTTAHVARIAGSNFPPLLVALLICSVRRGSPATSARHDDHDDRAAGREQDVPDRVRRRVSQHRDRAS